MGLEIVIMENYSQKSVNSARKIVKILSFALKATKIDGFDNPLKIDGFGRTHATPAPQ